MSAVEEQRSSDQSSPAFTKEQADRIYRFAALAVRIAGTEEAAARELSVEPQLLSFVLGGGVAGASVARALARYFWISLDELAALPRSTGSRVRVSEMLSVPEKLETFAQRLQFAMFVRQMGVADLDRLLEKSSGYISRVIADNRTPREKTVRKICSALESRADWLHYGEGLPFEPAIAVKERATMPFSSLREMIGIGGDDGPSVEERRVDRLDRIEELHALYLREIHRLNRAAVLRVEIVFMLRELGRGGLDDEAGGEWLEKEKASLFAKLEELKAELEPRRHEGEVTS